MDLLFAPICTGCDEPGNRGCKNCQKDSFPIPEPLSDICGSPQKKHGICHTCLISRPPYHSLRSWTVFEGPIRNALHHLKHRRDFGCKQIALVAYPFSLQMRLGYSSHALIRKIHTLSQMGLTAAERKKNVEGAFWADARLSNGKSILLMDKVATTGSTLSTSAAALVEAGATRVYAFTLARALSHSD